MKKSSPIIELERMTPKELQKELSMKRAECSRLRIAIEIGSDKNHARHKVLRREIARMTMVHRHMPKTQKTVAPAVEVKTVKAKKTPVSSRSPKKK